MYMSVGFVAFVALIGLIVWYITQWWNNRKGGSA